MPDAELIAARAQFALECGEEMACAVYGFGEDWLQGFKLKKEIEEVGGELTPPLFLSVVRLFQSSNATF